MAMKPLDPSSRPSMSGTSSVNATADPAQESLVHALRASFNILRVLMIVLVVLYLLSGIFAVDPGQQGLVARFGKLRTNPAADGGTVFEQGWYWSLPDPFDEKITVEGEVKELRVTSFLNKHEDAATATDLAKVVQRASALQPGVDGAMLTGDKNLSHGRWEVQFHIRDGALFVENVGETIADLQPLLQRLTETAVVQEVGGRTVEDVTRERIDEVRTGVKRRLQGLLDRFNTGVEVNQVEARTIEPGPVRGAFIQVSAAENEKRQTIEVALGRAEDTLKGVAGEQFGGLLALIDEYGQAQRDEVSADKLGEILARIDAKLEEAEAAGTGEVATMLSDARSQADAVNERLMQEVEEFHKLLEQRNEKPRITLLGLWVQMRASVLGNKNNEVLFVPNTDEIEILINKDPQKQIELERDRVQKRKQGG